MQRSLFDTLDTFSAEGLDQHLTNAIQTGRIPAGTRMPSVRALARQLGVAPGTVAKAYTGLQDRGLVAAERGRGTFVCADRAVFGQMGSTVRASPAAAFLGRHPRATLTARWLADSMVADGVQLMGGYGDVRKPLARAFSDFVARNGVAATGDITQLYPAEGARAARAMVAERISRLAGCPLDEGSIVFGQGANLLLDTTLRALTRPGDTIMTENPTYYGALDLFEAYGLNVAPVRRSAAGLDLDELARLCAAERCRLLYLTGSPSNPLGLVMGDDEEEALREIVRRFDLTVIEDSSLWPFQYGRSRLRPLFSTDISQHVILICSLSKWFFPSLRFAVAIGTSRTFARVNVVNRGVMRITSSFPQFAVAQYLHDDAFEADLEASRVLYLEAREATVRGIAAHLPDDVRHVMPDGGFTIWVNVPPSIPLDRLYAECLRCGVYPLPGHVFAVDGTSGNGLRIAFGQNSADRLDEGIRRLGQAMRAARTTGSTESGDFGKALA